MIKLKINGKEEEFPGGLPATLIDLLKYLNINEATIVAELDGKIVVREDFAKTVLTCGQNIELIRFVGGG